MSAQNAKPSLKLENKQAAFVSKFTQFKGQADRLAGSLVIPSC